MFSITKLCTPAYVYFVISVVLTILVVVLGSFASSDLCFGEYCGIEKFSIYIFLHFAWILFWTWVLNSICKGSPFISWFLVIFPYILFFFIILMALPIGST